MRSRQQGVLTNAPSFEEQRLWGSCSESAWVIDYTEASTKVGKVKSFDDVVTKQFAKKQRMGEFTFNPMLSVERELFQSSVGYVISAIAPQNCGGINRFTTYRSNESTMTALLKRALSTNFDGSIATPTSVVVPDADVARLVSECATKVRAKIRTGDAGGWETIAEFDKTIKLLRHPFEGVVKLTKALKTFSSSSVSKGVRSGAHLLSIPASEWLKYRYGVLPLINDIKAVLKTLNSQTRKIQKTERASAKSHGYATRDLVATFGVLETTFQEARHHEVYVRAMSCDEYLNDSAAQLGLTLDQIPKTAWDLIPFSFVVDWFANVSDFINACIPRPDVKHLGSCYTIRSVLTNTYSVKSARIVPAYAGQYGLDQAPGGAYVERRVTKQRFVGLPGPALIVKSDFRLDNDTRLADLAALITQQLRTFIIKTF